MSEIKIFRSGFRQVLLILCVGAVTLTYSGCARSPQAKRDKHLAAGKALLAKKDYRRAILEFQNAVQAMPADAESHYELGLAFTSLGDAQHGYNNIKRAVELDPKHQQAQLKLAEFRAASQDLDLVKMGQDELKKLADVSTTPEIMNALALTQFRLGETADATQTLEDAVKRFPGELGSSIMLAKTRLAQKDVSGAEEILKKACQSAPKSADPHTVLGEFYVSQHRFPEAEAEFQKALSIEPKKYNALFDLARLQNTAGEKQQAEQSFKALANSGEKQFRPIYAVYLLYTGRGDDAVAQLEKLYRQDPGDRPTRKLLVSSYLAAHRTADAEKILAEALKKDAHDTDALSERAALLQAAGKFEDAEKDLNEVLHARPDSAEAHYTMSKVHQAQGRVLVERQDLAEAVRLNPNFLQARVEMAGLLVAGKDSKAALDLLDQAPAAQKRSVRWIVARNWILWGTRDLPGMRKGIDEGLAVAKTPDLLIQDGLWKLQHDDFPGGRAAAEEALKLAPTDVRAAEVLYRSYVVKKEWSTGLVKVLSYTSGVKSAPVQEYVGNILLENNDRERARAAFNAAKAADPRYIQADFSLVQVDVLDKKIDDARNRLKAMVAADDHNATTHFWLGAVERIAGNQAAAIDEYRKAVAIDGQNVQALNNLAFLLADYADKADEALSYAEKARELDPSNPHTADTLGWIYYHKGMYSSAIKQMETGASEDQGNAVIKYHLAMAYAKSGEDEKGRTTLQAAMKLNPNLPEAGVAATVVGGSR